MEFTDKMFQDFLNTGKFEIPESTPVYDWPRAPEFFLGLLGWVMQRRDRISVHVDFEKKGYTVHFNYDEFIAGDFR